MSECPYGLLTNCGTGDLSRGAYHRHLTPLVRYGGHVARISSVMSCRPASALVALRRFINGLKRML
jgi:hypothetical protein